MEKKHCELMLKFSGMKITNRKQIQCFGESSDYGVYAWMTPTILSNYVNFTNNRNMNIFQSLSMTQVSWKRPIEIRGQGKKRSLQNYYIKMSCDNYQRFGKTQQFC